MRSKDPPTPDSSGDDVGHHLTVHRGRLLAELGMTLAELSEPVGLTLANLSVLEDRPGESGALPHAQCGLRRTRRATR